MPLKAEPARPSSKGGPLSSFASDRLCAPSRVAPSLADMRAGVGQIRRTYALQYSKAESKLEAGAPSIYKDPGLQTHVIA